MTSIRRYRWLAVALAVVLVTNLLGCGGGSGVSRRGSRSASLLQPAASVSPADFVCVGDLDGDGQPTVGDAIKILRIVVGLDPDDPYADANQNGSTDVGDAIKVLRCVVGLDDWPIGIAGLSTAVGDGGEGCAAVSSLGDGAAWSDTGTLTVPAGAEELFIGSVPGYANADLNHAEIKLISPDDSQTITLANGTATSSGFAEQQPTDPALDATLQDYVDGLSAELPANPTEEDVERLLERVINGDPQGSLPEISDAVLVQLEAYSATLRGLTDTILTSGGPRAPSDGLVILGPQSGNWTIEASGQASAGAFTSLVWALPAAADYGTSLENIAQALAGTTGTAQVGSAQGGCTGCDPGCKNLIDKFKNPSTQWTYEWWRAKTIATAWWLVMGALTVAAYAYAAKLLTGLVPVALLVALNISEKALLATATTVVGLLSVVWLGLEAKAEDIYWRFAYTMTSPERYTTVCYLGLQGTLLPNWNPTVQLAPGESKDLKLCAGNAMKDWLPLELWGRWRPADSLNTATWSVDPPVGFATFSPHGFLFSQCELEAPSQPTVTDSKLIVTVDNQPAQGVFPVEIGAGCGSYTLAGDPDGTKPMEVTGPDMLVIPYWDPCWSNRGGEWRIVNVNPRVGPKEPTVIRSRKGEAINAYIHGTGGPGTCTVKDVYLRKGTMQHNGRATQWVKLIPAFTIELPEYVPGQPSVWVQTHTIPF